MKKILALTAIAAGLFAGTASATTVTYTNSNGPGYTLQTTNWTALLNLAKFNIAGQILDSAVLSYQGDFASAGQIDSEDATATTVVVNTGVGLKFFGDGTNGSTDLAAGSAFTDTLNLAADLFDGILAADDEAGAADFAGPDSATGLTSTAAGSGTFNIVNLALVQGAGDFNIFLRALSSLSISGTANLSSDILTEARGQVSITYTYHDAPPPSVPEPAGIALMGLGLAGFAAARKKKQA